MSVINEKDSYALSLLRVIGCLMIIICHWCNASDSSLLNNAAQIFNSAIYLFFFISGYLFSLKTVGNIRRWYFKRWLRLSVPEYIYIIITIIYCSVLTGSFAIKLKGIAIWLFNLQGFVALNIEEGITGHLWFLTFIAICYVITPFLQKLKERKLARFVFTASLVILQIILYVIFSKSFLQFFCGIIVYVTAYFYGQKLFEKMSWKMVFISMAVAVALGGLRVVLRAKASSEGSLLSKLYDGVLSQYSSIAIAFFIIIFAVVFIRATYNFAIKFQKPILFTDSISYEIYITHYMFIKGVASLMNVTPYIIVNLLLIILASVIYATVLHYISELIVKKIGVQHRSLGGFKHA